jgi:hypothetical protein
MDGNTERSPQSGEQGTGNAPAFPVAASTENADRTALTPWLSPQNTEQAPTFPAEHGTPPAVDEGTGKEHEAEHSRPGPFRRWRERVRQNAEHRAEERREARNVTEGRKRTERRLAEQTQNAERVAAAGRSAARSRRGTRAAATTELTDEQVAPIPAWMRWLGIWTGRVFGSWPLIAPLVVSGWYSAHVFMDAPLSTPVALAIMVTLALEGGLYKLVVLREKTLLEGDSTIGLTVWIGVWITLIGSLIFAHAVIVALGDQAVSVDSITTVDLGWSWIPAAGTAAFSILGVAIYGRDARYRHRVALRAKGKVDKQGPKFALLSWLVCPIETPRAFRHAVKYRLDRPQDALDDYRDYRAAGRPSVWPLTSDVTAAAALAPADLIRKIWISSPVLSRALGEVYGEVLDDAAADGTLSALFAPLTVHQMEQELGTVRGELMRGTPRGTGNGADGVTVFPLGTQSGTFPASARNGEGNGGQNGTQNGTQNGEHPERTLAGERAGEREGTPPGAVRSPGNGAEEQGTQNGTQNGAQNGQGTTDKIPFLDHVLTITAAFPRWRYENEMPSNRKATDAVDAEYRARGIAAGYNSTGHIFKVIKFLRTVRDDPDFPARLEEIRRQRTLTDPT